MTPYWYAIVSESCPAINTTRKTDGDANDLARKLREDYPDVEVVPMWRDAGARAGDGNLPPLPEPFGHFCEWAQRGPYPPTQAMYYGGPGNGIDDDWNCHPEVHKNAPLYTADQMRAYALAAAPAAAPAASLEALRAHRDTLPFGEVRSAFNAAIDRLDVAISKEAHAENPSPATAEGGQP